MSGDCDPLTTDRETAIDAGATARTATAGAHWHMLYASVRGAAHRRNGLPNQDAVRISRTGPGLVLALADGHGSATSFRSQQGARLAVAVALQVAARWPELPTASHHKRRAEDDWPKELVRGWQAVVDARLGRRPFTAAEMNPLEPSARQRLERNPRLAWGSTLLSVILTPSSILYLQLGDGDLLVVDDNGQVNRPLPADPRLLGNETTSLCAPEAWREARVYCQTLVAAPPALILAATDGYANAFRDDAGFRQVASDLWVMLRDEGQAAVQAQLAGWLNETSAQGSGDDISVGILWREAT